MSGLSVPGSMQGIVSVDANVLVRFLVKDEGAMDQCESAKDLFKRHGVFLPESVFLETEWVLRAVYGVSREDICAALNKVLGLG